MSRTNGYTKFPNSIITFLSRARLGVLQMKMILATVRNCHGFHKPDREFGQAELRNWLPPYWTETGQVEWDRRTIFKVAQRLVKRGVFVIRRADEKRSKYQIQNDCQKWDLGWNKKTVHNPVDNSVDSHSPGVTKDAPEGDSRHLYPPKPEVHQEDLFAQENAEIGKLSTLVDLALKKSLKKEKKEEPPDRKRRLKIFKKMAQSTFWSDAELFELIMKHSPEDLEALYEQEFNRRRA
jgi:hypothetical protein